MNHVPTIQQLRCYERHQLARIEKAKRRLEQIHGQIAERELDETHEKREEQTPCDR